MTISLPKPLRTYQYRPLTVFSLIDTDTDRVLPQLFEMCVKGGRSSRSRTDAGNFAGYREALVRSGAVVGYEPRHQALLDGWLRTCVVDMGTVGRSRSGEQMLAVAPLTLAAYRAGLPKERTRHRGIDDLVYQVLVAELARTEGQGNAVAQLRDLVVRTVGRGLEIGPQPRWEPRLSDPAQLDIGALLELRFLEGFEMADARKVDDVVADGPMPRVAADLGATLLAHLRVYGDRLPPQSLMGGFAALLATGIYTFTLRTDAAARELLRTGTLPSDMASAGTDTTPPSELEIYCDVTEDIGSQSDRLAKRCVERDLDRTRLAFRDRMTFVVVEQVLNRIADEKSRYETLDRPARLELLASLRGHRRVESSCEAQIDNLVADPGDSATETEVDFLRQVQGQDTSELDKLLDVMQFVNETKALKNSVGWLSSVGGLRKPYGLLHGLSANRRTWRYAPSDEQLTALLLALFVGPGGQSHRTSMPLQSVLDRLHDRYGILIDRPPRFLDGAEARAAATANLEAFKRRLQLLGCFDSLSDDFSVQVVRHPLGDAR
ncbi:hypothetical protein LQ327_31450 [Actinomycetospora endophytica]|uniref:Uncharacterized protein n=1 Tax=Actinomycetospora endophytica TaxID=2291215 RepID=A0ABS8PI12_9PSEU|nr:hypothetical protein [Actinomycetospora endophytica]MCD2197895.1 hypothetical protein [Actinomycetospora endophytica]